MKINQLGRVVEAKMKCNKTPAGEACPVHGLKECARYSMTEATEEVTCSQCGKGFSSKGLKAPYQTGFSHCKDHKGMKIVSEDRTEVKDKEGKVVSWKDEGEWKKSTAKKDPRGKVTNMSDRARKETEKLSKNESLKEAHILSMHVEDDHEVKMAQGDLYQMAKKTIALHKMLDNVDQLEGWVQGKVTLAADYIATVYDYMDHQLAMAGNIDGIGEQMAEAIMPTGSTVSAKKLPPQTAQIVKKVAQGLNPSQNAVMTDPEGNVSVVAKKDVAKKNAQGNMQVTEDDGPAGQYKSLNDAYPAGSTEVWYWKEDFARDAMMGANWLAKKGLMPKPENISDNYVLIGKIAETNPEKVYMMMQGEMWSPRGQARSMIRSSGTGHTSMSMGDIVKIGGKFMMVDRFGFQDITQQPQEESVNVRLKAKPMDESVMSEIDLELSAIAKTQDMDALYDLLTANTPTGKYVQNMADDIAIDNRFLDDDHEKLLDNLMDQIVDDFGIDESLKEDLQADSGEYYQDSADFFGLFDADHFDKEETSDDGMDVRGYIDGKLVMAWRFNGPDMTDGYGAYDDSELDESTFADAGATLGSTLGAAGGFALSKKKSGYVAGAAVGSAIGATAGKWLDKKLGNKPKSPEEMKEADEPEADGNENGVYQMRKVINLRGQYDVPFADGKKVRVPVNMAHAVLQKFASLRMPNDKLAFTRAVTKSFDSLKAAIGVREDVDARARKIFGEDWGTSDTSAAINMMKEYIRSTHGGRYNPETIEDAARDAGEFYYDQMGYDTPEDAADSLVSHFVRRWMSGSLKAD